LLVVSSDAAWISRLSALSRGWAIDFAHASDLGALMRGAAPAPTGAVVLDWAPGALARKDRDQTEDFRRRLPGYVMIFASVSDGPAADWLSAALASGADGFVAKAASSARLAGELRGHLRRGAEAARREKNRLLCHGGVMLDLGRGRVLLRRRDDWRPAPALSRKEESLLGFFLEHPGRLFDRGAILEAVWGERATEVIAQTLDKSVSSLRRKLGSHGRCLRMVHGRGYKWE